MSEEDEIKVLMAREIVEEICGDLDGGDRIRCRTIMHRILVRGEGFEALSELPEDCRKTIKEKLRELGVE